MACKSLPAHGRWAAWLRRLALLPIAIAASAGLTTCAPVPVADDEGHASFAQQIVPLVLGRGATSIESEVIADLAQLKGRAVVTQMLMKDEAFIKTWTPIIVDFLQLQREDANQLAGQDKKCWGPPTRANPDPTIAWWVRDHRPTDPGAPTPEWNMTDLVESALLTDNVSTVYLAYLFPFAMRRADYISWQDWTARDQLVQRFLKIYLNRNVSCLGCHNEFGNAADKTNSSGTIVWRRLWGLYGDADTALFKDVYDAGGIANSLHAIMRGDVRQPAADRWPFGIQPWGMSKDCARDTADDSPNNDPNSWQNNPPGGYRYAGFQTTPPDLTEDTNYPTADFGSLSKTGNHGNKQVSLWELEAALRNGITGLRNGYTRYPPSGSSLPANMQNYCDMNTVFQQCKGCHWGSSPAGGLNLATNDPAGQLVNMSVTSPGSLSANKRVIPSDLAHSELWRRVSAASTASWSMPPSGPLPAADLQTIQTWIANGAAHTVNTNACTSSPLPQVDPDEALAYLTAANLVDNIWTAAMGYPLTAPHGFPRFKEPRDQLGTTTEFTFLPNSWSLKAVLTSIASSNWFTRRAPAISQRDNAYKLPPILNPWIVADPTVVTNPTPDQTSNGQGERVYPYRVSTSLRRIAGALGWKEPSPAMFPEAGYPSALALNLGQAVSAQHPGFSGINFQSLLAREAEVATCDKTNRLPAGVTDDWIDALVNGIGIFNATNPGAPITLGEAWKMVKDRLIQDPTINNVLPASLVNVAGAKTEQQALVDFFRTLYGDPTLTLNSTAAAGSPADITKLQNAMRRSCGILLKDPFFLLANITPKYSDNNMPDPPRLNVCLPNEPCSYAAVCNRWTPILFGMGYNIACLDHSVVELPMVSYPNSNATGRVAAGAPPSGQDWAVLTRRSTEPSARLRLPPAAPTSPPATAAGPLPPPPAEFDLLHDVQIKSPTPLRGPARVSQRMATMCPGGLCGGVPRAAPNVARCVENPADNNCAALFPVCDPRTQTGENSCGALPADVTASHVLVLWAEGANVEDANNARLLRAGDERWRPLQPRATLAPGDMIHVPFTASIRLRYDSVLFGDGAMTEPQVGELAGHLLAITGPSSEKLLERAPRPGALSPAALIRGIQSGAFETRPMTELAWRRALAATAHQDRTSPLTPAQIKEMNAHFDALHRGLPRATPK